jgi:hypothetical protein
MNDSIRTARKICASVVAATLTLLPHAAVFADSPPHKPYDIYLLIGQSNMAGRGAVDAESKRANARVVMLNKDGQWEPATDPLHFDKPAIAGVGPGLAFGKAIAEAQPQAVIGLVPCAVGGTSILVWAPGMMDPATNTHPYDDMLARMRLALKDGTLKGILWHQGEADRSDAGIVRYARNLTELVARLRQDLGAPDVPFVSGELGQFSEHNRAATAAMNDILNGLAQTTTHYACVSAGGLMDRGDHVHFDTTSARILGGRYAAAMLRLQGAAP